MARDPNQLKYPESWVDTVDDLKKLPPPAGANKAEWDAKVAGGDYYANVKVYADGRRVVEWYQRGVGGGPGKPDPVQATANDVLPTVKEEWDKEEDKPSATRVINGVPHQVTGKDANGQDIWSPVQTATGPAAPTNTAQRQEWRSEGTPDGQGGFDNSRPIMAEYVNGKRTGATRAPTADELKDWNEAGQRSRNPGGQSDADIAAQTERDRQATRQAEADQRANEAAARSARAEERNAETAAANSRRADAQEARQGAAANRHTMPDGTVMELDPDTKTWRPMRTEGTGRDPLPTGIPEFTPNTTSLDMGLAARRAQLLEAQRQGRITDAQVVAELTWNRELAEITGKNLGAQVQIQETSRAAEQTERGRLTTEAGQRANLASSLFGGASRNAAAAKILPGAGGAVADAFLAEIGLGQHTAQSMGGMNYPGQMGAYPLLQPAGGPPPAAAGVVTPPVQPQAGGGVTINIGGGNPPPVSEAAQAAGHPYSTSPAPYPSDWFRPTGQQPAAAGVVNPAAAPMDLSAGLKADGIVEDLASLGFDMSDLTL